MKIATKAGQPPKYPKLPSGSDWHAKHSGNADTKPDAYECAKKAGDDIKAYVAAFDARMRFAPAY